MGLILLAIVLRSLAAFCAKEAALLSSGQSLLAVLNGWLVAEVVVLGLQAVAWAFVLRRHALSFAYPFMSLVFALNLLMAWLVFGETILPQHILGIVIILVGVLVVSMSKTDTQKGPVTDVSA